MNPIAIGTLVFACTFGGVLAGMGLKAVLPEHHLSDESKDTVKIVIGLIATMTALVLGLITASAKSSFDNTDREIKHAAAEILTLDRILARYGPETREIREVLYHALEHRVEMTWPQKSSRATALDGPNVMQGAESISVLIRGLSPQNDDQRWLQSRALSIGEDLLESRWEVFTNSGTSVPTPFLVVLTFWLTIIFVSFGLFAPRNTLVIAVFIFCTISVACAVFLILELGSPLEGLMKISQDPLRFALSHMNQ